MYTPFPVSIYTPYRVFVDRLSTQVEETTSLSRGEAMHRLSVQKGKLVTLRRFMAGERETHELAKKRFMKLVLDNFIKKKRTAKAGAVAQQQNRGSRKGHSRQRAGASGGGNGGAAACCSSSHGSEEEEEEDN